MSHCTRLWKVVVVVDAADRAAALGSAGEASVRGVVDAWGPSGGVAQPSGTIGADTGCEVVKGQQEREDFRYMRGNGMRRDTFGTLLSGFLRRGRKEILVLFGGSHLL